MFAAALLAVSVITAPRLRLIIDANEHNDDTEYHITPDTAT